MALFGGWRTDVDAESVGSWRWRFWARSVGKMKPYEERFREFEAPEDAKYLTSNVPAHRKAVSDG
jgi:hypothetical protein